MASPRKLPKRPHAADKRIRFDDLPALQQARYLWSKNKLLEAASLFDAVARQHPTNVRALVDASRAMGALYQHQRAEELLRQAELVGGESGKAMELIGQSYRLLRRPQKAISCFLQALEKDHNQPDCHLELAILFERQGLNDIARTHCDQRLSLLPLDAEAKFLIGLLLRRVGQFESSRSELASVANSQEVHWLTRAKAYSELAKLQDYLGNYEEAWTAMLAGKALLAPFASSAREHRNLLLEPLLKLASELTPTDLLKWTENQPPTTSQVPRPVLLTGLPRSGTTIFASELSKWKGVCAADEYDVFPKLIFPMMLGQVKPNNFSVAELVGLADERISQLRTSYLTFFGSALPACVNAEILLDKNPSLFPLLPMFFRLFGLGSIAVMLRDPRDLLVSCLLEFFPLNDFGVDFLSPMSALDRIVADLRTWQALRSKLPESAWIEFRYEEFVTEPKTVLGRAKNWLGISDGANVMNQRNPEMAVFSPSYHQVTKSIRSESVGRWRNYAKQLEMLRPRFDDLRHLEST